MKRTTFVHLSNKELCGVGVFGVYWQMYLLIDFASSISSEVEVDPVLALDSVEDFNTIIWAHGGEQLGLLLAVCCAACF